mmetsp:Transcript_21471/g.31112  ORF Transcript_21471/g.31112 Transcript_21471/m.31112 type:complete len:137 (+) Transcript_21471:111-521(+)
MSPASVRILGSQLKRRISKSNSRQHHKRFDSYAKWTSRSVVRKKDKSNETVSTFLFSAETDLNNNPDSYCHQESRPRRRKNIVIEELKFQVGKLIPPFTILAWPFRKGLRLFLRGKGYDDYKRKVVLVRSQTGCLA